MIASAGWLWALLGAGLALGAPEAGSPSLPDALFAAPPDEPVETLVYYNARLALAEGKPDEAMRLWLLRNTLADNQSLFSPYDGDFFSVSWAAMGELGLCQDGFPADVDGAGLWPLGLHNWVVRNLSRRTPRKRTRAFDAFQTDRQQRVVTAHDVLDAREIKGLTFVKSACFRPQLDLWRAGEVLKARLSDRQVAARYVLRLLNRAEETLDAERVRGRSVLAARRFDVYLQLAALAAREARQQSSAKAGLGRRIGLPSATLNEIRSEAPGSTLSPSSSAGKVLVACVAWPVDEWMALSPDRRRFLFSRAREFGGDPAQLDATALGIIDALAARGDGAEVVAWIGLRLADPATTPELVWRGDRGQRLLALDAGQGFGERGVLALHRGVDELEAGALPDALRSFAFALRHAPESASADVVARLSRRWLSYVAGQFALTESLVLTLRELVPPRDFSVLLEDLLWRATFHVDVSSFELAASHQTSRGALLRRVDLLRPLARGDAGRFANEVRAGLIGSPSETLRFLDQFVDRLSLEDAELRARHATTLRLIIQVSEAHLARDPRLERRITALTDQCRSLLAGLAVGNPWADTVDRARALGPDDEVFSGSLRLAPADALPWPFRVTDVTSPSVFTPIKLRPVTWWDASGQRVLGWSLEG